MEPYFGEEKLLPLFHGDALPIRGAGKDIFFFFFLNSDAERSSSEQ